MTRELIGCVVASLVFLASTQGVGCTGGGCEETIEVGAGEYRIVEARKVGSKEQWLADALVDGQLEIDLENDVATLHYTREGTSYEVRFTIDHD